MSTTPLLLLLFTAFMVSASVVLGISGGRLKYRKTWKKSYGPISRERTFPEQLPDRNPYRKVPEVDQHCLNCICQASSNCDETLKCYKAGSYLCGPYIISWAYWYDSGRPGDRGRPRDFEACLTNRKCSEESVRGYMRRYGRDCDASGFVDCFDFARIHKLGFDRCYREDILHTAFWKKFEKCYGYDDRPSDRSAPEDDDYYYYRHQYDKY